MPSRLRALVRGVLMLAGVAGPGAAAAQAQELEARSYAPSPVGATFVLAGFGRSAGGIVFDPSADVSNVQADLWVATFGVGRTFSVGGRQARVLAVFPAAWGRISGDVQAQSERQTLGGLVDPRLKLSVGLIGAPALRPAEFSRAAKRASFGASITAIPPLGQYNRTDLVNLGYHRWALKPEVGAALPAGRWTLEGYAGGWFYTSNRAYFPGGAIRKQNPVLALQAHASYALPHRMWLAVDGTWFTGGDSRVNDVPNPDLQRNARVGVTFSLPVAPQQSLKLTYSTGASTRRGSDFNTFNILWQLVRL